MERAYWEGSNLLHLSLDTVVAAVFYQLSRRSSERRRNATPYLLRGLICKLYGAGKGNLWRAQVHASQTALAADQGVSRQRTNELIQRLVTAERSRYHALRFLDGRFEVGFFNIHGFFIKNGLIFKEIGAYRILCSGEITSLPPPPPATTITFFAALQQLLDPCNPQDKRHDLAFVLCGVVSTLMAGRTQVSNTHRFLHNRFEWLREITHAAVSQCLSRAAHPRLLAQIDWSALNTLESVQR